MFQNLACNRCGRVEAAQPARWCYGFEIRFEEEKWRSEVKEENKTEEKNEKDGGKLKRCRKGGVLRVSLFVSGS